MSAALKIVVVASACLLVGAAGVLWQLAWGEDPDRTTVGEAVERFRDGGRASRRLDAKPGVYRYATRGFERADAGGPLDSTHEYDGVSTISVTRGECGLRERWEVFATRWSVAEFCVPPDGAGLRSIAEFHEFFGVESEDSFRCEGDAPSRRALREIGTRFVSRCRGDGGTATSTSRVTAATTIAVGGEPVDAVRTVTRVALGGDVSGTTVRNDWRRRADGLLVRRTVDTDARRGGTVSARYTESYTIKLLSLRPRQ